MEISLALKSPIWRVLTSETQKRETGSIESDGDLRGCSGVSESESVISENLGFSSEFTGFLTFLNDTFLCKFRRIRGLRRAWEFLNVTNSVPDTFLRKLCHFSDLDETGGF